MKKFSHILSAAIVCLLAIACRKEVPEEPFLYLGDELKDDTFSCNCKGTVYDGNTLLKYDEAWATPGLCPRVSIYSNLQEWKVSPRMEADSKWIFVWPPKGKDCGRFYISVDKNDYAESRSAELDITDADGKVWKTISIFQDGSVPFLELDMGGISNFNMAAESGSLVIKLRTNTLWSVSASSEMPSWLTISDYTDNSFRVNASQNTDDGERSADFIVERTDKETTPLSIHFTITQIGGKNAFSKASEISIKELKDTYESHGKVDDNVYIEGVVISDYTKYNIDEHFYTYTKDGADFKADIANIPMWLQDAEGNGISVEFISPADNVYLPGTRMKLHLFSHSLGRNDAGVLRLAGLSSAYVHDAVQSSEPEPVQISDLNLIADYEDRLVTLKDVQFAVPYGTYFNVDNRQVGLNYTDFPAMIDASVRQYPHVLIGKNGATVRLLSASTFLDRHCRLMPEGVGDVTGIVSRRFTLGGKTEFYLRLRSDKDNRVPEKRGPSNAKILVRFGPFAERVDMDQVRANEGSAVIKTSMFSKASAESSSTSMYFNAYSTIWNKPMENIDVNVVPIVPSGSNQYFTLNSQQWYNGTGTTLIDCPGEAWIIKTNTLDAGTGKLYIIMSNASYSTGPKDFCLEWAEDEDAPIADWHKITEYQACSWSANYQSGQFVFPLPDEVKGKGVIVFRHRVTSDMSVYSPTRKIASTGTNRMSYWALVEM